MGYPDINPWTHAIEHSHPRYIPPRDTLTKIPGSYPLNMHTPKSRLVSRGKHIVELLIHVVIVEGYIYIENPQSRHLLLDIPTPNIDIISSMSFCEFEKNRQFH